MPEVKPAGTRATEGCVKTPAGWDVTAAGCVGWPVTTPSELVCVRKLVAGFEYGTVDVVLLSCAAAKAAKAIGRRVKNCIMMVVCGSECGYSSSS